MLETCVYDTTNNRSSPFSLSPSLSLFLSLSPSSFSLSLLYSSLTDNLKGMYESSGKLSDTTADAVKSAVGEVANVCQVASTDAQMLRFAGITFASNLPVLLTFQLGSKVTVNSEKMVINSVLLKTIKEAIGHS